MIKAKLKAALQNAVKSFSKKRNLYLKLPIFCMPCITNVISNGFKIFHEAVSKHYLTGFPRFRKLQRKEILKSQFHDNTSSSTHLVFRRRFL